LCNECIKLFDRIEIGTHELTNEDSIKILKIIEEYKTKKPIYNGGEGGINP